MTDAPALTIDDASTDSDWDEAALVEASGFGSTLDDGRRWLTSIRDHATIRLARRDGRPVGMYVLIPVEQFHGGRPVAAAAVASVAVAPDARRSGVAAAMLTDLPQTARRLGAVVAPLYAATTRLYRRWGWEIGGRAMRRSVNARALSNLYGEGTLMRDPSLDECARLARDVASEHDGAVARNSWWLGLPEYPKPVHSYLFGWRENDSLTGFVSAHQHAQDAKGLVIRVNALVTTTPDALRGLLGTLGAMESMAETITFANAASPLLDDALFLLPEPHRDIEATARMAWMQRIVDVDGALTARGWAQGLSGEIHLSVTDPVYQERRLVLALADGRAEVVDGGDGHVHVDAGTLAAWYVGALTMPQARRLGRATGDRTTMDRMDAAIPHRPLWAGADF